MGETFGLLIIILYQTYYTLDKVNNSFCAKFISTIH
ncbi:hypothetical protein EDF66_12811 [Sphingobacterium sp. JUb20]|nr:hypothetical protein [Sphingobacterium sp. JUb21]TCQ95423.1 hypothetical protein EDF66_12811 [Sphingobacterium sp. JUb20]